MTVERWKMGADSLVQGLSSSRRWRLPASTSNFYSLSCRSRSSRTGAYEPPSFCPSSRRHEIIFHDISQGYRRPVSFPLTSFTIDRSSAFRRELSLVTLSVPPLKSAWLSTFSQIRPQTAVNCWSYTPPFFAGVGCDVPAAPFPSCGKALSSFYQKENVSYASLRHVVDKSRRTLQLNSRAGGAGIAQRVVKCTYSPLRQQECWSRSGSLGSEGHPLLSFDLFDTAISNGRCRAVQTLGDATNDCAPRSFRLIIEWTSYLLLFLLLGAIMTGQLTIIERRIDVHIKSLCMLTAVYGGISLWGLEVSRLGAKGGSAVGGGVGISSIRYILGCCSVGLSTLPLILSEVISPCAGYITITVPVLFQLLSYRFLKRQSNRLSLPFSFYRSSSLGQQKPLPSKPFSHSPTALWGSVSSTSSTFCSTSLPSSFSSNVTAPSPTSSPGSFGTSVADCTSYSPLSVSTRDSEKRAAKLCDTLGVSQTLAKKEGVVSSAVGQCKDGPTSVSSFIEPMIYEKFLFLSMNDHRDSLLLPEWWGHSWRQRGLPLLLLLSAAVGCYRVKQVEATASTCIAKDADEQRPPLHDTAEGLGDIGNDCQERGLWKAFLTIFWRQDEKNEGGGGCSHTVEPEELKRDRDDAAVMQRARERLLGRNKTTSGGGGSSLS
ncbi:transmembrane protein [Cystoisospora suis]|uniref:Transmembrane protein n=1 Tax=Cystoisospora suis TaxID=483139 RepID=A0A2C6KSV0_9APIC|nr:transmembrane protein [Cystoisospora suis]